jgi:hypothetical protein
LATLERTVRLARPHAAQAQILKEKRRYNVVALGRRAGKSKLAQQLLVECALERKPGGYFCPTYKLLEEFWRELKVVLREIISEKSEQEHRLQVYGGGTVECWSMDTGDPARGRRYGTVVIDEAAMVPRLSEIWGQAIRPTLSDFQGSAWFMSTPRGLNDFYTLYVRGEDPLEDQWAAWQMPTSVNPYIAPDEIESARHDLTEREFAQEYLAEFLSIEGAGVFRSVHAVARLQPAGPLKGHAHVFGVDWGRSNDYTVVSVLDATLMEQRLVDRFSQIEYEFQTARLQKIVDVYHPVQIVAEANSMGGPLVERLQRGWVDAMGRRHAPLPVYGWTATNATKAAMVQSLALGIEQGLVTLLDDRVQTSELLAFESETTPGGVTRYGAPAGMHDDTVVALGLAFLGAHHESSGPARTRYGFAGGRR